MLKCDEKTIKKMEEQHPGITETIRRFEELDIMPCPFCHSKDTASVQVGVIGRTIYLATATTKFKLLANNPKGYKLFCNTCGRFSKRWRKKPFRKRGRHIYSEEELRFSAALYATRDDVIDALRQTGKLPDVHSVYGFTATIRELDQKRGRNIILTEREQMVYEAIKRERNLMAGGVRLFADSGPLFSTYDTQEIAWWGEE